MDSPTFYSGVTVGSENMDSPIFYSTGRARVLHYGQVHYVGNWHEGKEFADINHLPGSIKYFASLIQLLSLDRDDSILLFLKVSQKIKSKFRYKFTA